MTAATSPPQADFQVIQATGLKLIQTTRRRLATASPASGWLEFIRERASRGWVVEVARPLENILSRHGESIVGLEVKLAAADLLAAFTEAVRFRPERQEDRTRGPGDPVNVAPPGEPSEWRDTWPESATPAAVREFEELVAVLGGTYTRLLTLTRSIFADIPSDAAALDEWDERPDAYAEDNTPQAESTAVELKNEKAVMLIRAIQQAGGRLRAKDVPRATNKEVTVANARRLARQSRELGLIEPYQKTGDPSYRLTAAGLNWPLPTASPPKSCE